MIDLSLSLIERDVTKISPKIRLQWDMRRTVNRWFFSPHNLWCGGILFALSVCLSLHLYVWSLWHKTLTSTITFRLLDLVCIIMCDLILARFCLRLYEWTGTSASQSIGGGGPAVTRWITSPGVRILDEPWKISGTLFSVPHLSRNLALVHADGGQGASRVLVLYTGIVKEPRGLVETS